MLEVPVAPTLPGPFLVTSTKGLIWIADKFPSGVVRAAVRKVPLPFLYRETLEAIEALARGNQWGSVQAQTPEGVKAAWEYLAEYDLTEVECLFGSGFPVEILPVDLPSEEEVWVPDGWAILIPKDRGFVGTSFDFGAGQVASVIHNAARGIGFLVP